MLKTLHFAFIFLSIVSFSGRFGLSIINSQILENKLVKVVPHVIDTLLILSGIALVFHGNWLAGEFGWIVSKLILLSGYVLFGFYAMRSTGMKKWLFFSGAILSFLFIFHVAMSKTGFF